MYYQRNINFYGGSFLKENKFNIRVCFMLPSKLREAVEEYATDNEMSFSCAVRALISDEFRRRDRKARGIITKAWHDEKQRGRPHVKFNKAMKEGSLRRKPCSVCGATEKIHGHHEDYSKPTEVIWLCQKHHAELHKEKRKLAKKVEGVDEVWGI